MSVLPIHLSHTRLNEILINLTDEQGNVYDFTPGCLYAHQQREYRNYQEPTNDLADSGLRFHAFAKVYVERLVKYKRWKDERAATNIMGGFAMADPQLTDRDRRNLEKLCRIFLLGYEHEEGQIFCERRFAYSWPDMQPVDPNAPVPRIAGSIDHLRIKGTNGYVLDYKSGPGAKFATYNAYHDLQLQMYCWLASLAFPEVQTWHGTLWGLARGPQNKAPAEWTAEVLDGLVRPRVARGFEVVQAEYEASLDKDTVPVRIEGQAARHEPIQMRDWTASGHRQNCRYCRVPCPKLPAYLEAIRGAA